MRLEEDIKLDYKDVLIRPKRSTLESRKEVELERKFTFRNFEPYDLIDIVEDYHYWGIPIMAANMDGVGTFEMADTLAKQGLFI
jgi:GMP reductase